MDEFIKIRIEELKILRENILQKHREELAKVDVRLDELKGMLDDATNYSSDEEGIDLTTVNKVASVLKEEDSVEVIEAEKQQETQFDDFKIGIEEEIVVPKNNNSEEVDLEAMLNDL